MITRKKGTSPLVHPITTQRVMLRLGCSTGHTMQFNIQEKDLTPLLINNNLFGGGIKDRLSTGSLDLGGKPHAGVGKEKSAASILWAWCPWRARFRHSYILRETRVRKTVLENCIKFNLEINRALDSHINYVFGKCPLPLSEWSWICRHEGLGTRAEYVIWGAQSKIKMQAYCSKLLISRRLQ